MTGTAPPSPEEPAGPEEMPAWVREALAEVFAAVETVNRDQAAAIAEQAFERSADLRERAEALRQRKAAILRAWQQAQEARPPEPGAAADGGRDPGSS
jgi:hypothetical protein